MKKPTARADLAINCNVKDYIKYLLKNKKLKTNKYSVLKWKEKLLNLKKKYPVSKEYVNKHKNYVSSFKFVDDLCKFLKDNDVVVTDMGTSFTCTMQAFQAKNNQRLWTSSGLASMGYGLPAAIGACIGGGKKRTICIAGDGGLLFNLQELQTVIHYKLPIKIFLIDNEGYLTQKLMMKKNFKFLAGADKKSGVSMPSFYNVIKGFGINTNILKDKNKINKSISNFLKDDKLQTLIVKMDPFQPLIPRYQTKIINGKFIKQGLESMYPFVKDIDHKKNLNL